MHHGGQLAYGEAVAHAEAIHAHKTLVTRLHHVAFHGHAPQGVRPIQDDQLLARLRAGLHGIEHGGNKGVVPDTQVLNVVNHGIHLLEPFRAQLSPGLAIETIHHDPGIRIPVGIHIAAGLHIPPEAMLRAE